MKVNDPEILAYLSHSMVARIATLSRRGRPSVNPLYFIHFDEAVLLGTAEWTLAARNVKADSRVSVLFDAERAPRDRRILRILGTARVRTDPEIMRIYNVQVARKYLLSPGGIRNTLTHLKQFQVQQRYRAQSAEKGKPCVIEVTAEEVEFLAMKGRF